MGVAFYEEEITSERAPGAGVYHLSIDPSGVGPGPGSRRCVLLYLSSGLGESDSQ